jgi:hypothetical protein
MCTHAFFLPMKRLALHSLLLVYFQLPAFAQNAPPLIAGDRIDVDIHGNVSVLSTNKNLLSLYKKDFTILKEVGGSGWENDQFDKPHGLWARNGIDVFVADYGNHRIQRFDRDLSYISTFSTRGSTNPDERVGYPTDVAVSRLGDLFICDGENARIVKVNRFSKVERTFGGFDAGGGRLLRPLDLEVGPEDRVYVLDGNRVMVFDNFGNFVHELLPGSFHNPRAIFADGRSVVVLDTRALYCFDANERPARTISLESLGMAAEATIRSLTFSGNTLFLLTSDGVQQLPDPRPDNSGLDKDEKTQ